MHSKYRFFEGPEKKVEIVVRSGLPSLKALGEQAWRQIVGRAGASVISKISNAVCDAYLLSESSLFLYDDRVIAITCGKTTLVDAVEEILHHVDLADIQLLIYERKNELFPEYQASNFYDDVRRLKELMPGRAFRFGDEDDHHILLFHLDSEQESPAEDMTLEMLMHGIDRRVRALFNSGTSRGVAEIRRKTGICEVLPGFEVDDHLFEPAGYSLNAINGSEYFTFHVSPEELGSYASFETNHRFDSDLEATVHRVLEIFGPKSCDILCFRSFEGPRPIRCSYHLKREILERLDCGYEVQFFHYFRPQDGIERAEEVRL